MHSKRILKGLLLCHLVLVAFLSYGQQDTTRYFYFYGDSIVHLKYVSTTHVFVEFNSNTTLATKNQILTSTGVFSAIGMNTPPTNTSGYIVNVLPNNSVNNILSGLQNLLSNTNVLCANPFFALDSNKLGQDIVSGITDELILKLKTANDSIYLDTIAKQSKVLITRDSAFENVYILSANKFSTPSNALDAANFFHNTGKFDFVEPNFLSINCNNSAPFPPNDTYFNQQWGLQNTGQFSGTPGIDADIQDAWKITMGNPRIKIAIVDNGVDLNHPDLINNLLPGINIPGTGAAGSPTILGSQDDFHGTACAGIAAAQANNSIGIAGVCPSCSIIPVRAEVGNTLTANDYALGIQDAWTLGADIISCSLSNPPSQIIKNAIVSAMLSGRNGLGCVLFFSTGNDNSATLDFPAIISYLSAFPGQGVIVSVGGIDQCGERFQGGQCGFSSSCGSCPKGVHGSNYGGELDVVAPGINVSTTDITGSNGDCPGDAEGDGYSCLGSDYLQTFAGTSAAAPFAAGVAGLMLSANPCLTGYNLKRILDLSCTKVAGAYVPGYDGPNSPQVGYGMVNAYHAVQYSFSSAIQSYSDAFQPGTTVVGYSSINQTCNTCGYFLQGGNQIGLGAGTYFVNQYQVFENVSYPYTENPVIVGTATGFQNADADNFMAVTSITPTSATLTTFIYQFYDVNGFIGVFPTTAPNVRWDFFVLSANSPEQFFQNQNVTPAQSASYSDIAEIDAGYSVTNSIGFGDYNVLNGTTINFRAGQKILLENGFNANPGCSFVAKVAPFFTCTQYPNGRMMNPNDTGSTNLIKGFTHVNNSAIPPNSGEYNVLDSNSVGNFPNPFTNQTNIVYNISSKAQFIKITIFDELGNKLVEIKNDNGCLPGKYEIQINGANFAPGLYFYSFETDHTRIVRKMIKI